MKNLLLLLFSIILCFPLKANSPSLDSLMATLSSQRGVERVACLNQISTILLEEDLSQAKAYADKAFYLAENLKDVEGMAAATDNYGFIFQAKHDYSNAMKSFVEGLKIRNGVNDVKGVAISRNHIGRVFYLQENYAQAEENLKTSLGLWTELDDPSGTAIVNKNLGDVYLAKKFYGKAQEIYTKALDQKLQINDVEGAAKIANHIGKVSSDLGDYEGALVYYQMSLDLHASVANLPKIAVDYNNMTLALLQQHALEDALETNESALQIREQLKDTFGLAEVYKNFGLIYHKKQENNKAMQALDQSVALLENLDPDPQTPPIYKAISETYAALNHFDKAYQYQLAFAKTRDVIFNQEKDRDLLELTTQYESEYAAKEQKRKIDLLEIENSANKKISIFLTAVVGLIAMLLLSLFFSYKRKQKDNQLLRIKNGEIRQQKEEIKNKNQELENNNTKLDLLNSKLVEEIAERESIEKSSFARDSFLSTMSHEMRTPINIITGLTHLLLDEAPRTDQIEHLRTLQFAANNLVVFINDVLDFSKIEAGKLDLEKRDFYPSKTFAEIQNRFDNQADELGASIHYSFDKKIPDKLFGDSARFNQITTNLIAASCNYTNEGEIDVELELNELTTKEATLLLRISDNGVGIEPEKIDAMFKSFTDSETETFEGYASPGIPLAITKRLIDLQNGKIEVDSRLDGGTTFTVFLPFQLPIDMKESDKKMDKPSLGQLAASKILVVEDNKINQLVVAKMLRKLNIEVVTADDGLEALKIFDSEKFDLVLMDIQMPKMDGYRCTAEMRKTSDPEKRDIPIIALTASAFLTRKEKAKLFGMNEHVGKPFAPEELLEKIRSCLEVYKNA